MKSEFRISSYASTDTTNLPDCLKKTLKSWTKFIVSMKNGDPAALYAQIILRLTGKIDLDTLLKH